MGKCGYCGSRIMVGGIASGTERYCNNKCRTNGVTLRAAATVPSELVERKSEELFHSNCPKCNGSGPVDVYKAYRVYSVVIITRWETTSQVCCRSCGTRSQWGAVIFSILLGWWGLPWGLVLTPVQISRNLISILARRDSSRPSEDLRRLVLIHAGAQQLQKHKLPPPLPA